MVISKNKLLLRDTQKHCNFCASIFTSFLCYYAFRWTVSAKDFPHIYNGINLRKTPPTVATEGRGTLILIYVFEEAVMTRNQQKYPD